MEISELHTLVRARFDDARRTLSLPAADLRSPGVEELCRAFLGGETLDLVEATLELSDDGATVAGVLVGTFFSWTGLRALARFGVVDGDAELVVTVSEFPVGWRLSDALPSLAGSVADAFEYRDVTFTLDSLDRDGLAPDFQTAYGFAASSPALEPDVRRGLRLSCTISAGEALGNLRWLLAGDAVRLDGPIESLGAERRMLLRSQPFDAVSIGSFRVPAELEIVSFFEDAPSLPSGVFTMTMLRLAATLERDTQGGSLVIPIATMIGGEMAVVRFEGRIEPPAPLHFSEIATFLEGVVVDGLRPTSNGFPPLDALALESLGFAVLVVGEPRLVDVSIGLVLEHEWSVFGNLFRFRNPRLRFVVSNPTADPSPSASLECTVDFAGATFDGYVGLPELIFGLELDQGSTVELGPLVQSLLPGPLDIPSITCSSLRVTGDVRNGAFALVAALSNDWTIYDGLGPRSLTLSDLMLALDYEAGGHVTGELKGTLAVAGVHVGVSVRHLNAVDGWTLEATTGDHEKIDLGTLVREVFELFGIDVPDHLPEVTLKNLYLYHNTSTGALGVRGENEVASQVRLGDVVHDVDTYLDLLVERDQHAGGHTYTGHLRGSLTLGGAEFDVAWDFGAADVLRGSWDAASGGTLEFADLAASHGIDHDLELPMPGGLSLARAAFEFDLTRSRFLLSADSTHYGEAFFVASNANDRWDFVFGVVTNLSAIPGFPDLGALSIRDVSVILSTVRDDAFRVPSLPTLAAASDAAPASRRVFPAIGSTSTPIAPGVTVAAVLDFDVSGSGLVMDNLRSVIGAAELLVQVRISDSVVGSALRAYLAGSLTLPGAGGQKIVLSNPYVQIELAPLGVIVSGSVLVPIQDVTLVADGAMAITDEEMQALFDVRAEVDGQPASLPFPFGLRGVRLDELAVAVGVIFEPPGVDLGLEGMFNVIGQPAGANAFTLVLELEGEIPNPLYLSAYFESLTIADTFTAVSGETLPDLPSVLAEMRAEDLLVYWSETPGLVLPDGTLTQSGFGFNGIVAIGGFDAHSGFSLSAITGISGDAEMAPIDLHGILRVEGEGAGVSVLQELVDGEWRTIRSVSDAGSGVQTRSYQIVSAGGPTIAFSSKRSPFVDVTARVSLFNFVGAEVEVVVASDRLSFELAGNIGSAVHFSFACTLSSSGFAASTAFDLGIAGEIGPLEIAGVDLGSIRLDVSLAAEMSVAVDASGVTVTVGGKFWFDDFHLTLPTLTLHEDFRSLEDLPGVILQHIRELASEIFADVFDVAARLLEDAAAEARAIGDAITGEADRIAGDAAADAQRIVSEAQATYAGVVAGIADAEQAAQALDHEAQQIVGAATVEVAQIGQAAEQEVSRIADEAKQVFDGATAEVAEIGRVTEHEVEALASQATALADAAATEVTRIADAAEHEAEAIIGDAQGVAASVVNEAEVVAHALRAETQRILDDIAEAAREAAAWIERQSESAWHTIKKY